MPDGSRAGKVTGQQLAAELEAKAAKEAADFAAMGVQVTGRGAETVGDTACCQVVGQAGIALARLSLACSLCHS